MPEATSTVLPLCFDAPMQSWGTHSHGVVRDTATEPTKSGVLGVLGAALGVDRDDEDGLAELAQLTMGVRVDREGIIERDFQTTQNVPTTTGSGHRTVISERYYLADALFLVVLEGESGLLTRIARALRRPHWRLHLGRRAFVPTRPILIQPGTPASATMLETLDTHPWLAHPPALHRAEAAKPPDARSQLRRIVECPPHTSGAEPRHDQPLSFAPGRRRFTTRYVHTSVVDLTDALLVTETPGEPACT